MKRIPTALTIAGSDSGGGAGIQADLKTFQALGVHGMSAITAITAQNTVDVAAVHEVPSEMVREQIDQVATDIGIDAAKTGMLVNRSIVMAVADAVREHSISPLVVDPVMSSSTGHRLLESEAIGALLEELFPLAAIVTPNLQEASALLGVEVSDLEGMRHAAEKLQAMGPRAVLITGGHLEGDAVDVLFDGSSFKEFGAQRVATINTHGTGCTFSAAITAELAKRSSIEVAVASAKLFVTGAIKGGKTLGKGHGPVQQGWNAAEES